MRIIVKETDTMLADLRFDRQAVYVGSRPGCGVHLPDARVGLQQDVLLPDNGNRWSVEHLDSAHVTRLNGLPLSGRRQIHNGDELTIEHYVLKVYLDLETQIVEMQRAARRESPMEARRRKLPAGAKIKRHTDPVELSIADLHRVSTHAHRLMNCRTIRDLMDMTLTALLQTFGGRCAWVGLRRRHPGELEFVEGRRASGEPCAPPALTAELTYRCLERAQHVCLPRTHDREIGSAMAVPIVAPDGHLGALYVDRGKRAEPYELIHLDLLSTMAAQTAVQLETIVHNLARRHEQMAVTEISVAHEIQTYLQPKSMPEWDTMHLAVYSRPGDTSCGDFYDFVKRPDGCGTLFIANCNAPGPLSASVVGQLRATFRLAALRGNTPHSILRQMNWLLSSGSRSERVKCWSMRFEPATGKVAYAYAGQFGALVIGAEGEPRLLTETPSPELGETPDIPYQSTTTTLVPGQTMALFTPGVTQMTNMAGEPFGPERLIESLCDSFGQPAGTMLSLAQSDLEAFAKDGRHDDDITIILIHRSAR